MCSGLSGRRRRFAQFLLAGYQGTVKSLICSGSVFFLFRSNIRVFTFRRYSYSVFAIVVSSKGEGDFCEMAVFWESVFAILVERIVWLNV
jgi:hypothetical protein